jgi:hypothetical protein
MLILGILAKYQAYLFQEIIFMKKQCMVLSAALLILFVGCSILHKGHKQDIAGTWTGEAIVAYQGNSKVYDVILTLGKDTAMTLSYDIGGKILTFTGNYTADFSKKPVQIDILNFGFPKGDKYCCMAIAEFPMINKMNISGQIGKCGEVSRPTKIIRNPTDNHQLNLELTKKE